MNIKQLGDRGLENSSVLVEQFCSAMVWNSRFKDVFVKYDGLTCPQCDEIGYIKCFTGENFDNYQEILSPNIMFTREYINDAEIKNGDIIRIRFDKSTHSMIGIGKH